MKLLLLQSATSTVISSLSKVTGQKTLTILLVFMSLIYFFILFLSVSLLFVLSQHHFIMSDHGLFLIAHVVFMRALKVQLNSSCERELM